MVSEYRKSMGRKSRHQKAFEQPKENAPRRICFVKQVSLKHLKDESVGADGTAIGRRFHSLGRLLRKDLSK